MKPLSDDLKALLASREYLAANLYLFTLYDGSTLAYTDFDRDLAWSAVTYKCGGETGPYFERGSNRARSRWTRGLTVDDLAFDVQAGTATVKGLPFIQATNVGWFDGARFKRYRAYMDPAAPTTVVGVFLMFSGRIGEIAAGRSLITFTVKALTELLNIQLPRILYATRCTHVLYDTGCTLSRAAFTTAGVKALAGSSRSLIRAQLSPATGYFDIGVVSFTSGKNSGLSRTIKSWTNGSPGTILLTAEFPFAPQVNDQFSIYPGCDLTLATCDSKFNNLLNFGGTPFVPAPETAS